MKIKQSNRLFRFREIILTLSIITLLSSCVASSPTDANVDLNSVSWIHGAQNCDNITSREDYQEWQTVHFRPNTFIFRQNKCSNYEGPFVYLFIGTQSSLLIDTGATVAGGVKLEELVRSKTDLPLLVAHSHGHGDHRLGDDAFRNTDNTSVVAIGADAVKSRFGFTDWPNEPASIALGNRDIEILPIPGHNDDDLAFFDEQTGVVVTGDSLYPGRLYVRNWQEYQKSTARLVNWVDQKSVSLVLGTHIEMSNTPNQDYPVGTTFQPQEHQLPLSVADIRNLQNAVESSEVPVRIPLGSFIVWPVN